MRYDSPCTNNAVLPNMHSRENLATKPKPTIILYNYRPFTRQWLWSHRFTNIFKTMRMIRYMDKTRKKNMLSYLNSIDGSNTTILPYPCSIAYLNPRRIFLLSINSYRSYKRISPNTYPLPYEKALRVLNLYIFGNIEIVGTGT